MGVRWAARARADLERIHGFLHDVNSAAAIKAVDGILRGVERLASHPRLGKRLPEFAPREIRRLIVGDYELRYELQEDELFVLRIWHAREDR
jgi:plasmid stabilization system protein ParE